MWDKLVSLSYDNQQVIAKLRPDMNIDGRFDSKGVDPFHGGEDPSGLRRPPDPQSKSQDRAPARSRGGGACDAQ